MVLLEEDEVKTQFCKEEVREESEASSSIYYFSKHLTFSQLLKLKRKLSLQSIFMGPGARQLLMWMSQEHPVQRKQLQEAGKSSQISPGFTG